MKDKKIKIGLLMLLCLFSLGARAQSDEDVNILTKAEEAFNYGLFERSDSILKLNIRKLSADYKIKAYRLLALSALNRDESAEADNYAIRLLEIDPYYQVYDEPKLFADLITSHKEEEAGITTASRQAESLQETPVPVTVITNDMIRYSGAQTLQELLTLYVPGMTAAEGMETNIAMRGIYSITQNKILFLQDGHRLNGGSTQAETPDYRNSLDKIDHIEVLRGPASSLYGSVALTAVVNIITYKGSQLGFDSGKDGGARASATLGTQKTLGGSFVTGGGNNVLDVMGWGSINRTDGFRHVIDNAIGGTTTLYSHGFRDRPSYDIGVKGRWKDFTVSFNSQRSKQCPYINILQLPATQTVDATSQKVLPEGTNLDGVKNFSYDNYTNVNSNGPGTTRTNHHLNIDYSHTWGDFTFSAAAYMSLENTSIYNVMGDSIDHSLASTILYAMMVQQLRDDNLDAQSIVGKSAMSSFIQNPWIRNVRQVLEWQNYTVGEQMQAQKGYHLWGHGTAMLGMQAEYFRLTGDMLALGGESSMSTVYPMDIMLSEAIKHGHENLVGVFGQFKHYMPGDQFIVNAGLRYDHKHRFDGNNLNRLSPRVSLIFKQNKEWAYLASYNYSLVDAPYLYRASTIKFFSGGPNLKPETMNSLQLGSNFHHDFTSKRQHIHQLKADMSVFYNSMDNLISVNNTNKDTYLFANSGKVTQTGVELSLQYTRDYFLIVNANASWQRILSSKSYRVYNHETNGTPEFSSNINVAWRAWGGSGKTFMKQGELWLRAQLRMQSRTDYFTTDYLNCYYYHRAYGERTYVGAQFIPSIGVVYERNHFTLDLSLRNIFNNQYMIGSLLNDAVPHDGRQFLAKVTLKI